MNRDGSGFASVAQARRDIQSPQWAPDNTGSIFFITIRRTKIGFSTPRQLKEVARPLAPDEPYGGGSYSVSRTALSFIADAPIIPATSRLHQRACAFSPLSQELLTAESSRPRRGEFGTNLQRTSAKFMAGLFSRPVRSFQEISLSGIHGRPFAITRPPSISEKQVGFHGYCAYTKPRGSTSYGEIANSFISYPGDDLTISTRRRRRRRQGYIDTNISMSRRSGRGVLTAWTIEQPPVPRSRALYRHQL